MAPICSAEALEKTCICHKAIGQHFTTDFQAAMEEVHELCKLYIR